MTVPSITARILDSLMKPGAYPVHTDSVELLQTHISWLFLTDSHVFKIKKPVNFGFLDFSTLELRHFYCAEEVRLNRRLCPDMYEQVIALRETDAGAAFTGNGTIIEYAVMMKRLPADRMLDRLVDNGSITLEEIERIAREIARFHATAQTSPHISQCGSLEQIRFNWNENFQQTEVFSSSTLPPAVCRTIRSYVDSFLERHRSLFEERIQRGYIRDGDGDLHLGNICLYNNSAYIFDCIEFNERFRFGDTAADLAFLLMDLDYHHRPDLSEAVLSTYISASGDGGIMALIPFYKIYRAFVRGKVESMRLLDDGITEAEQAAAEKRAGSYFRLAQGYCVREALPPTLYITCGTMGSGKSTLAGQISFELGLANFNSDRIRKKLAHIPPESAVHVPFSSGLYSREMTRQTYCRLEQLAATELSAGRSVVIDASFGSASEREVFSHVAAAHHARFIILSVECDQQEQQKRLQHRTAEGASVSDGRLELLQQQINTFEFPHTAEKQVVTITSGEATEQVLNTLYQRLLGGYHPAPE